MTTNSVDAGKFPMKAPAKLRLYREFQSGASVEELAMRYGRSQEEVEAIIRALLPPAPK